MCIFRGSAAITRAGEKERNSWENTGGKGRVPLLKQIKAILLKPYLGNPGIKEGFKGELSIVEGEEVNTL